VPDIMTQAGLCDIIALGNLCELGQLLHWEFYVGEVSAEEMEECTVAWWHYHQFQLWFSTHYSISVGETLITPLSVFQCSLVEFMAAVVNHKYFYVDQVPPVEGCLDMELNVRVRDHLESEYPELVDCLTDLMAKCHTHFAWSGPAMKIRECQSDDELQESLDFEDFNFFSSNDDGSMDSSSDSEHSMPVGRRPTWKAPVLRGK
jgi:hypothetical protein